MLCMSNVCMIFYFTEDDTQWPLSEQDTQGPYSFAALLMLILSPD